MSKIIKTLLIIILLVVISSIGYADITPDFIIDFDDWDFTLPFYPITPPSIIELPPFLYEPPIVEPPVQELPIHEPPTPEPPIIDESFSNKITLDLEEYNISIEIIESFNNSHNIQFYIRTKSFYPAGCSNLSAYINTKFDTIDINIGGVIGISNICLACDAPVSYTDTLELIMGKYILKFHLEIDNTIHTYALNVSPYGISVEDATIEPPIVEAPVQEPPIYEPPTIEPPILEPLPLPFEFLPFEPPFEILPFPYRPPFEYF